MHTMPPSRPVEQHWHESADAASAPPSPPSLAPPSPGGGDTKGATLQQAAPHGAAASNLYEAQVIVTGPSPHAGLVWPVAYRLATDSQAATSGRGDGFGGGSTHSHRRQLSTARPQT